MTQHKLSLAGRFLMAVYYLFLDFVNNLVLQLVTMELLSLMLKLKKKHVEQMTPPNKLKK